VTVNPELEAARLYNLGVQQRRAGKLAESIDAYRRAQQLTPEDPELLNNLALALQDDGRPSEAVPLLQLAVGLAPTLVAAHINLGNALRSSGERARAIPSYLRAIDLDDRSAVAHYNLFAAVYDDDPLAAEASLERALTLRPKHEMTRFQLAATRAWRLEQSEVPADLPPFLRDSYAFAAAERDDDTQLFSDTFAALDHGLSLARDAGPVVELGVRFGTSLRFLAARVAPDRVHGFDSFEGLPTEWQQLARGSYSTRGSLPEVPPNAQLHPGWFENTLADFAGPQLRLLHVDCDVYASTRLALDRLAPRLDSGSVIVFDDYLCNPQWRQDEHRAWTEAARAHGWRHRYCAFGFFSRQAVVKLA
jgi:hypothetical protein